MLGSPFKGILLFSKMQRGCPGRDATRHLTHTLYERAEFIALFFPNQIPLKI